MKKSILYIYFILFNSNLLFADWTNVDVTVDSTTTNKGFYRPKIAMNSNGYVVAAWGIYTPDPAFASTLKASISTDFGTSWGSVTTIDAANPSEFAQLLFPDISLDSSNRAIIVWSKTATLAIPQVKATPYGVTAISVTILDSDAGEATVEDTIPHVAMNDSLDAIAIWNYRQATDQWFVRRSTSSDGGVNWSALEVIDPTISLFIKNTAIVMDNSSNALVAWNFEAANGDNFLKTANSSDNGANWLNINTLNPLVSTGTPPEPQLAMDSSGNAIVVYDSVTSLLIFPLVAFSSNRGTSWSNSKSLDTLGSEQAVHLNIAMNEFGHAIVVWVFTDSNLNSFVRTAFSSDFGQNWSDAQTIDHENPCDENTMPDIKMDDHGNAVIVWERVVGSVHEIKAANSSNLGIHWDISLLDTVELIIIPNVQSLIQPQVALNTKESTNAINMTAIWTDTDTDQPISKVLTQNFGSLILDISGSQQKVRELLQIELRNLIKADSIGQTGTFKFYSDAALTNLLSSITNKNELATFIDHDIKKDQTKTYFVTWTNSIGGVIGPTSVTIQGS